MTHEQKLAAAKRQVESMDEIDGGDRSIGTIIAALECGLRNPDTSAAYDALWMLMDCRESVRHCPRLSVTSLKELLKIVGDIVNDDQARNN